MSDFDMWESRYSASGYLFGETPNYFLVSCKDKLPPSGKVLCVADGEGRNGVWLAEQGLDVLSLDFSPTAQEKARELAAKKGVDIDFREGDVHSWDYPENAFDVVVDVFSQFSSPEQRAEKWDGVKRALKPGGLLILVGYSPDQLKHGTGGPKALENLYTKALLEENFAELSGIDILEEELEMQEGPGHAGLSAVISLIGIG